MITTASLSDVDKNAWCREHGVYPADLEQWCASATTALAEPQDARASPQATRQDRKRIKDLERGLLRKDRALAEAAALLVLSKKVAAIYNKGEDAMSLIADRRSLAQDIQAARDAGARLEQFCEVAGIDARTLQRWNAHAGLTQGDGRPHAIRATPSHALSADERARLLSVANEARFSAVPPARIVPMLADEGVYLASESTFARVLRAHGQTAHRGRAKAPKAKRPATTHIASGVSQV